MRSVLLVGAGILVGGCTFAGNPRSGGDDEVPVDEDESFRSCQAALEAGHAASGVYSIDPGDGDEPFPAFCDQTTGGGGWTLAIKADGMTQTFAYNAPMWSSGTPYNPDRPDHDLTEAKLGSFARLDADEILLESANGVVSKDLIGEFPLVERFGSAIPELLLGSLQPWLELVPGSEIATCAQVDAVNFGDARYRVRIGLLSQDFAEDEGDCEADFAGAIGIGLEINQTCDDGDVLSTLTVGSIYGGCEEIPSFVYLYVR